MLLILKTHNIIIGADKKINTYPNMGLVKMRYPNVKPARNRYFRVFLISSLLYPFNNANINSGINDGANTSGKA
jgi:hypothetical protein